MFSISFTGTHVKEVHLAKMQDSQVKELVMVLLGKIVFFKGKSRHK